MSRATRIALGLAPILCALVVASLCVGSASERLDAFAFGPPELWKGTLGLFDRADGLSAGAQAIFTLRLHEALTAVASGALLATAGLLLQGLFRNDLAAPSLLGVSAGANVGATLVLFFSGFGTAELVVDSLPSAFGLSLASIGGAFAVSLILLGIIGRSASRGTATLLLLGVALNATLAAVLAMVQDLLLAQNRYELLETVTNLTTGQIGERSSHHTAIAMAGLVGLFAIAPFVTRELDLLASGEKDARSLGVDTNRVRVLTLTAACLATGCAVSASGQIIFVGLVVPHLARALVGHSHRPLLLVCPLLGALFLIGTDLAQILLVGYRALGPGVVSSLFGGPFFLVLLMRRRSVL